MNTEMEEVKYYKPRFTRWVGSAYWDSITNELSDIHIAIVTQVMNAEKAADFS